jgi:hypothetical protein
MVDTEGGGGSTLASDNAAGAEGGGSQPAAVFWSALSTGSAGCPIAIPDSWASGAFLEPATVVASKRMHEAIWQTTVMMNKTVAAANAPVPGGTHLPLPSGSRSLPVLTIAATMNSITTMMERSLQRACHMYLQTASEVVSFFFLGPLYTNVP